MKKSLVYLTLLLCVSMVLNTGCSDIEGDTAPDAAESIAPRQSVYADAAEQDAVYEILQKEWDYALTLESLDVTILKESITPVYYADIREYAQTGELRIESCVDSIHGGKGIRSDGNIYIAKLVTSDGRFGGNMEFFIEDGQAYGMLFLSSPATDSNSNWYYDASCSYADHARRIQDLLQKDCIVPVENVKFVAVAGFGKAFYISDGETDVLIPMGAFFADSDHLIGEHTHVYPVGGEDLNKLAAEKVEQRNQFLSELEALKKERPDTWMEYVGLRDQSSMSIVDWIYETEFDNILNISEYLDGSPHPLTYEEIMRLPTVCYAMVDRESFYSFDKYRRFSEEHNVALSPVCGEVMQVQYYLVGDRHKAGFTQGGFAVATLRITDVDDTYNRLGLSVGDTIHIWEDYYVEFADDFSKTEKTSAYIAKKTGNGQAVRIGEEPNPEVQELIPVTGEEYSKVFISGDTELPMGVGNRYTFCASERSMKADGHEMYGAFGVSCVGMTDIDRFMSEYNLNIDSDYRTAGEEIQRRFHLGR